MRGALEHELDPPPEGEAHRGGMERADRLPESVHQVVAMNLSNDGGSIGSVDSAAIFPKTNLGPPEPSCEEHGADVAAAPREEVNTASGVAHVEAGNDRRGVIGHRARGRQFDHWN